MSFRSLLAQQVVVLTSTITTDADGNQVKAWTAADPQPGRLEQTQGTEITTGRDIQVSDWLLFLLPDAVISGNSRAQIDGKTYEVLGPPQVVSDARSPHHLEARLRYVTGT